MTRRLAATTIAFIATVALAACSDGDQEEPASAETTPTVVASAPLDDATALEQSICSRLDGQAVADAVDQAAAREASANTFGNSLPLRDTCEVPVGEDTGEASDAVSNAVFGWSIETVDAAGFAALRDYWETNQGEFVDIVDADAGDDAFIVFRTGYALVGDRVVTAGWSGESSDPDQIEALLQLAVEAADPLPEPVPNRAVDACIALDEQAAAALGTEPTITRGSDAEQLGCLWGTGDTSVSLGAAPFGDEADFQVQLLTDSGGTEVDGLGTSSAFLGTDEGTFVRWATEDGLVVNVTVPFEQVDEDAIVALAKAAAPSYA